MSTFVDPFSDFPSDKRITAEQLTVAIEDYIEQSPVFNGHNSTDVDLSKLHLANCLLRYLGINYSCPDPPDQNGYQRLTPPPTRKKNIRSGFVYLMLNKRNGYIKIGFSKHPEKREKTLQSEEPELELIGIWYTTLVSELCLHLKFKHKRIRGEWFSLNSSDISEIRNFFDAEASHHV